MLILRRKTGESFLLGDQISVTILDIESNGTVSIGINAPKDVLILRSELQQAASANQDSANALSSPEMVKELEAALFQGQTNSNEPKEN